MTSGLSQNERARLRLLADDLRTENPRLARVLLRGAPDHGLRLTLGALVILVALALLAIGSPLSCLAALVANLIAMFVLRPGDPEEG